MKTNMVSNFMVMMVLSITALPQASKQNSFSATIAGQVRDVNGHPVPNARVLARLVPYPTPGIIPSAYTDPRGNFSIVVRNPGTYRLYAGKEELFYPITSTPFYDVDRVPAPEATVGNKDVVNDQIVMLNSRGAKLELRIIDAKTGQPVKEANIGFRRDDDPIDWIGTGLGPEDAGKLTILVPSVPIRIEIQSPGYKNWYYGEDGTTDQAFTLYLAPGTTKEIEVLLSRKRQ